MHPDFHFACSPAVEFHEGPLPRPARSLSVTRLIADAIKADCVYLLIYFSANKLLFFFFLSNRTYLKDGSARKKERSLFCNSVDMINLFKKMKLNITFTFIGVNKTLQSTVDV